jgi:hypothetical protein
MSQLVTLELSDEAVLRAERLANASGMSVGQILSEAVDASLPLVLPRVQSRPVADLSDAEVLSEQALRMSPDDDARLTILLEKQREGEISPVERQEMMSLMGAYSAGLLRKAEALAEAVKRGLRPPLAP